MPVKLDYLPIRGSRRDRPAMPSLGPAPRLEHITATVHLRSPQNLHKWLSENVVEQPGGATFLSRQDLAEQFGADPDDVARGGRDRVRGLRGQRVIGWSAREPGPRRLGELVPQHDDWHPAMEPVPERALTLCLADLLLAAQAEEAATPVG